MCTLHQSANKHLDKRDALAKASAHPALKQNGSSVSPTLTAQKQKKTPREET
jgi:hypothetical protein